MKWYKKVCIWNWCHRMNQQVLLKLEVQYCDYSSSCKNNFQSCHNVNELSETHRQYNVTLILSYIYDICGGESYRICIFFARENKKMIKNIVFSRPTAIHLSSNSYHPDCYNVTYYGVFFYLNHDIQGPLVGV